MADRFSVLFVCYGNTCRSVMAEYIAKKKIRDVRFESAGIHPGSALDTQNAVSTLRDSFGVDADGHQPRGLDSVDLASFDLIVAMDKQVAGHIKYKVPQSKLVTWDISDPYGNDLNEYSVCAKEIEYNVRGLEFRLTHGG